MPPWFGAALARMQLTAALEVLTRSWERVELAGDPGIDTTFGALTFQRLPIRVTPAALQTT
ncbi:hypothetical protein [Actinocorallia populi]|uniref:hypothetical protein n=1 Tax=Actinocorallia populi TaxID=2079200 RepID=UPI000D090238|nr:hypothetical protein [Actinocorallia populi]